MKNNINKEIEDGIGKFIIYIFIYLLKLIKYNYLGLMNIIKSFSLVKLGVILLGISTINYLLHIAYHNITYNLLTLAIPIIYLALKGYFMKKKKEKEINEKEKYLDKLRAIFGSKAEISIVNRKEDNGNLIEIFKSNIPLNVWRYKEDQIRHFYQVEHIDISYTPNRKCIKVTSFLEAPLDKRFQLEKLFNSTIELIKKDENDLKIVEIFKTEIHLEAWEKKLSQIKHIYNSTFTDLSYLMEKNETYIKLINYKVEIPKFIEWNDEYLDNSENIAIGNSMSKGNIKIDFNETPHLIVAGETGGGKSVLISCIIIQLISMGIKTNSKIDIVIADFKGGLDFIHFSSRLGIVTELDKFDKLLTNLYEENERRIKLLRDNKCKNIKEYNKKVKDKLPRKVFIIDEIAVVTDRTGASKENKEVMERIEGKLSDTARRSRATGINLIIGVQIPSFKILPGQIKNNCPGRICGRFADSTASNIVLGNNEAANLPAVKGRMIYKNGLDIVEFQGFYVDPEKEISKLFPETKDSKKNNKVDLTKKEAVDVSNPEVIDVNDSTKEIKNENFAFNRKDLEK
ncbi:MAG: FtsK/SpoIIIE domain-containing protein [Clostridiales bacterium]